MTPDVGRALGVILEPRDDCQGRPDGVEVRDCARKRGHQGSDNQATCGDEC